jgi:hypothetical protein
VTAAAPGASKGLKDVGEPRLGLPERKEEAWLPTLANLVVPDLTDARFGKGARVFPRYFDQPRHGFKAREVVVRASGGLVSVGAVAADNFDPKPCQSFGGSRPLAFAQAGSSGRSAKCVGESVSSKSVKSRQHP